MRKTRVKAEDFVRLWNEAVENRESINWDACWEYDMDFDKALKDSEIEVEDAPA